MKRTLSGTLLLAVLLSLGVMNLAAPSGLLLAPTTAWAGAIVVPDKSTDLSDLPAAVCTNQYLKGSAGAYICADVGGHTQGTDQGLDTGGANAVTAAAIKTLIDNTTGTNTGDSAGHSALAPLASPTFTDITTIADGTAAAPSLRFTSDADSGFFANAKGFGYAVDGAHRMSINNNGRLVLGMAGVYQTYLTGYGEVTVLGNDVQGAIVGGNNTDGHYAFLGLTGLLNTHVRLGTTNAITTTSGNYSYIRILPSYNQTSGTAANTDLLINRTQTAVGSGAQLLIDAQVGGVSKFSVSNAGSVMSQGINTGGYGVIGQQIDATGGNFRTYGLTTGIVASVQNSSIVGSWATANYGTRKGRLVFSVMDVGGTRTGLTIETDGTAATVTATKYAVSALNTAPSSASDTGTLGEIRITADYIYVCIATNTWVRSALATW